ncbi:MarR family winged helix-turn-helix transcriptional regulator [Phytomonospora endophytica]|uniref:DNA-binding MarR family transcriptional regulator n=1 Tax=Phytomonospora endophytica TaxID=714109 RepID=A0A841FS41_9ACTN|nr:MarR family winged helix-turn-helix transcriptional regulator [Phytomonospora endophytica]MBB6039075.1 DNA-binding MarR family transcriptional regulator [Phytomonospora endophytica]GIG63713.1 MarR family transcriptional regulator [Phytomonospora endophytica]
MTVTRGTAEAARVCPEPDRTSPNGDLSWLLHRAAQRIKTDLDEKARGYGLSGFRDWIVLAALVSGEKRTQLAISHEVALDKTTLTALLDRLERDGFIVRTVDPHDRRARVPEATEKGREVQAALQDCRDGVENAMLDEFTDEERNVFQHVLRRLAFGDGDGGLHGSCM